MWPDVAPLQREGGGVVAADKYAVYTVGVGSVVWFDNKLWVVGDNDTYDNTTDLWRPDEARVVSSYVTDVVPVAYSFRLGQATLDQMGTKPVYTHDCPNCTYLGTVRCRETQWTYGTRYDLYFCTQGGTIPTVLARWSDNGPDFTSGLLFAKEYIQAGLHFHPLVMAYTRAIAYGLLTGEEKL
jgi:hypothetical protein